MNYKQTLDFLYSQLPMYHRIGAAAYKADLDNTIAICNLLNNPQHHFKSIHIAGTNGKGSVSHMIASIMQSAGYKTGLYTSPHLKDFRERIKINGKMIPKKKVTTFIEENKKAFDRIKPSFFEMTVGLAFQYFKEEQIDVAIIETGLGGRLDSTNIINPLLSVITNISNDHSTLLGDTLEKIAMEKAGIIKRKIPVVIGQTQNDTKHVFIAKAGKEKATIQFADQLFQIKNLRHKNGLRPLFVVDVFRNNKIYYKDLSCELTGNYQKKNIATVLRSIEILNNIGYSIEEKFVRKGVEKVITNTGLNGRWQILQQKPLTIYDIGHNEDGIKQVLDQIKKTPHDKLHFVIGMVNDKDIEAIMRLLPKSAVYYFCKANIPRGMDALELAKIAGNHQLKGKVFFSVADALKAAQSRAKMNDLVFVGGSAFTVAEVI